MSQPGNCYRQDQDHEWWSDRKDQTTDGCRFVVPRLITTTSRRGLSPGINQTSYSSEHTRDAQGLSSIVQDCLQGSTARRRVAANIFNRFVAEARDRQDPGSDDENHQHSRGPAGHSVKIDFLLPLCIGSATSFRSFQSSPDARSQVTQEITQAIKGTSQVN